MTTENSAGFSIRKEIKLNFGNLSIKRFNNFFTFIKSTNKTTTMENEKHEAWNQPQPPQPLYRPDNKKVAAGILAILLGVFGVHKFILGYTTEGILMLVFSLVTCGVASSLIGLIEGIIYLTKTDEEFYQMYQVNKKGWF